MLWLLHLVVVCLCAIAGALAAWALSFARHLLDVALRPFLPDLGRCATTCRCCIPFVALEVDRQALVLLLEGLRVLLLLLQLSLHEAHLGVEVLVLVLEDLDVVFAGP